MDDITKCKDCEHGKPFVTCKAAKINHELLKYQCDKIRGKHNPNFFCGYGAPKKNK